VHDYGTWWSSEFSTVNAALAATATVNDIHELVRPFAALRRCKPSYDRVAGRAPEGLAAVEDESMRACRSAERAAGLIGLDRYVPNAKRQSTLSEVITALIGADRELVARLVLTRKLPTEARPTEESRIDSRYSEVVTDVVLFNTEVRCWSAVDWAAIRRETAALGPETSRAFFGAADAFLGVANLSPRACRSLDSLAYEGRRVTAARSRALLVALLSLGRESEHGAGDGADPEAQCDGLQDVRPLAAGLGATRAEADRLASLGWRLYRTKRLDPELWTAECRNDGPFDKDGSDVWP
jgi:hypothetical protein